MWYPYKGIREAVSGVCKLTVECGMMYVYLHCEGVVFMFADYC